jgi:hypothetical protein
MLIYNTRPLPVSVMISEKWPRSSKKRRRMEDQDPSEDWVHSNHFSMLSATLHDHAQADRCQELSKLSATPSSSFSGGNNRQWLHTDQPGGRYPWLRVFATTSSPLQPPDLGLDCAPTNALPTVFLLSLSVYNIGDFGLSDFLLPAPNYGLWISSCRSPGAPSPSRCLPWGERYL